MPFLESFGQDGVGLFPAATPVEGNALRQYEVALVGRLPEVRKRFFAISAERRIRHPAVSAICEVAREHIFRGDD